MSSKLFPVLAAFLVAACGSDQDELPPDPAPTSYSQMSHEQRIAFMTTTVLPQMKPLFVAFDAKFQNMSCATCHGNGATDGTYAMPSPQIPAIPGSEEAFLEYIKDPEHLRWATFMQDQVWPKIVELLHVPKFDPMTNAAGFSCTGCHTLMHP